MSLDFKNFQKNELGRLKQRNKQFNKYIRGLLIFLFLFIILLVLFMYGSIHKKWVPNFFINAPYVFFIVWTLIVVIVVYKVLPKANTIKLSFKDEILMYFCQAMFHLEEAKNKTDEKELKKSLRFFSNIAYGIETSSSYKNGFNFEAPINNFLDEFLIFLNSYIPKHLQISSLNEEVGRLHNPLLNIFIYLQDEDFKRMTQLLLKFTKKYHKPKKTLKSFVGQVRESLLLQFIFVILAIIIMDFVGWVLFKIFKSYYPHGIALTIIVAFTVGLPNLLKFIRSLASKFSED